MEASAKKKRSLRRAFAAWIAALLLLPVLLAACAFLIPAQNAEIYLGEMADKLALLRETDGARIILVGGSAVPFGVRCDLINRELPGFHTVDFGLYADLGLSVMLDLCLPELKEGDIVILMPEQDEQVFSEYFGAASVWQALDGHFTMLSRLEPSYLSRLLAAFPAFAGRKLGAFLRGGTHPEGIYRKASFTALGDILPELRPGSILADGYDANNPIRFDERMLSEAFVGKVRHFIREAEKRGARVLWHFAPMNAAALAPSEDGETVNAFYDLIRDRIGVEILGNPLDNLLDAGWFYDSNFHLNGSGAVVFSDLLIRDIKVYLGDSSRTVVGLPQMPAAVVSGIRGGWEDMDCFTYEISGFGWKVSGLSEKGRERTALTLPSRCPEGEIVGIQEYALCGSAILEEITIPPGYALPNGLFRECASLKRVILEGAPEDHAVDTILTGISDFAIFVEKDQLDSYRTDYFWQKYAARIKAI